MNLVLLSPLIYLLFYFIARPIVRRWFATWPLFGVPVGMVLGSVFFTWSVWMLVVLRVPMMNPAALWTVLLAAVAVCSFRTISLQQIRQEVKPLLINYVAFTLLASIYVSLRRYNADFVGLEKFPDLAFITSAFKSQLLPPLDPFAAGETINYYYFGHFQSAVMTHLHGVLPFQFLHFQVGNLFALSALILYSLGAFLYPWATRSTEHGAAVLSGLLSVFFGILSGNLQPFVEKVLLRNADYYYPSATRYIDNVIHEFPFYSFLVGDLHGHLMNLPNAALAVGLCAMLYDAAKKSNWSIKASLRDNFSVAVIILLGFSAGTSYVTNAWDILTTLLLAGFTMVAVSFDKNNFFEPRTLKYLAFASFVLTSLAIVFYLPYWLRFSPPAQGIGTVPPPKSTPFGQLVLIWGVHVPFAILAFRLIENRFVKTMSALGLVFIVLLEFFYMKDIYPTHFRANTMFKIGFQVWLWLSVVSAAAIAYICDPNTAVQRHLRSWKLTLAAVLITLGGYYTVIATPQALFGFNTPYSLDGRDFMRRSSPQDVALIDWMNLNLKHQPVVLEAVGDSFSEFGRVSAFTGNPTIVQWPVHEWLWRGSYNQPFKPVSKLQREGYEDTVGNRVEDVRKFYEAKTAAEATQILAKYRVEYFVISGKEREKYNGLNEKVLTSIGDVAFSDGPTALFKVKNAQ